MHFLFGRLLAGFLAIFACLGLANNMPQEPRAAHKTGERAVPFDGGLGHLVYPLGDAKLCPKGSLHFYSYSVQFSLSGDMVFICAYDWENPNLTNIPVYDRDFKLIFRDAIDASGLGYMGSHNFRNPQFSQKRRVIFVQDYGTRIYELDPWRRKSRVYVDFGALAITRPDGTKARVAGARDFKVGPNDEIVAEVGTPNKLVRPKSDCPDCYVQLGIAAYDPANGKIYAYSTERDGKGADYPNMKASTEGFDETNITQDGRIFSTYNLRPSWSFKLDFTDPVQFRHRAWPQYQSRGQVIEWSGHGHMGFFTGSNGRSYIVKVLNDLIDDGGDGTVDRVGQIGSSLNGRWRPSFLMANSKTGRVELIWGTEAVEKGWGLDHFSRSQAPDVFWGSSEQAITRFHVSYDSNGNPNKVSGDNIVNPKSDRGCGYWGQPRVASDSTGNRAMFDSTLAGHCVRQVYVIVRQ